MAIYRGIWALFMLLVVTPAFLLASTTELNSFHETSIRALILLQDLHVPYYLSLALEYPVAIVATILPGSSTLLPFLGNMIWEYVGVIFLAVALVNVEPPFYKPESKEE
ncbi:hypothetical protein [Pseudomonas helleri]|uniref:Uncharacterized protein n=1 Tax=Pseudomonas helleri TaxID=1608996 RepID=A0A7X1Y3U9_9PSED|nr:hypothetical protein [Pseudomonas helleri]MQT93059.1 hypothetical protein [Pseudomonas helleri]MQU29831.1 hypothetical protein [Pseudomonas helleri]